MFNRKISLCLLLSCIFIFICTSVNAQKDNVTVEEMVASAEGQVQELSPEEESNIAMNQGGTVSLDFREADIHNVFRVLSFKSGINIVSGPEVTGTVSIQLNDVPWEQALEVILSTRGYAYEKKGNIIMVMTVEDLKRKRENDNLLTEQEPLETEIFTLNFAKAEEVIASLDKMKSARGSINFDQRTNTIIITDIPGKIQSMSGVITKLDATTPQVVIESKIVETKLLDTENLGVSWTVGATATAGAITHTFPFTPPNIDNKYITETVESTSSVVSNGTLSFEQFSAVLEMLKTRTDTNIVSNPSIVTMDGREAFIEIVDKFPVISKTFSEETGTWVMSEPNYKDIGVTLTVTPYVNSASAVVLDLNVKVSSLLDIISDPVTGSQFPKINEEEAETKVMIKDGDTLVIGGLVKDNAVKTKRKVPFLGDIPVLGLLFTKTTDAVDKTDLLIFLTPRVITLDIETASLK